MKNSHWYLLIISVVGILIYFRSLFNGFVWDDFSQIILNYPIHSIGNIGYFFSGGTFFSQGTANLSGFYYKPVLTTFFSLIYTLFGSNPLAFHAFQLILHITNTILVFYLFKYFFKEKLAFFLSLVFLIHPINVESVAYISALQEPLFFLFGISSLLLLLKPSLKRLILASVLILLSILSKETGFGFLVVGFISLLIFHKQVVPIKIVGLFFTVAISAYFYLRFFVANVSSNYEIPIAHLSLEGRLLSLPKIIFFYFYTFLFPKDLVIWQIWEVHKINLFELFIPIIFLITTIMLAIVLGKHLYKKQKNDFKKYIFFSIWLTIGLGMHAQIFPLDMTVAERWFYFPIVGLLGIIGVLTPFLNVKNLNSRLIILLGIFIIGVLSVRSYFRIHDWKDPLTLYSHDVKVSWENPNLHNNLASVYLASNKYDQAKYHFNESLKLNPDNFLSLNGLGKISAIEKDYSQAKKYYFESLMVKEDFRSLFALAWLELKYGNPLEARNIALRGIEKYPYNGDLITTLSVIEYTSGNKILAVQLMGPLRKSNSSAAQYVYETIANNQKLDLERIFNDW